MRLGTALLPAIRGEPNGSRRSAGRFAVIDVGTVRPLAIRAMVELGIDISGQESKTVDRYLGEPFDAVITVCDQAAEACPVFPGARQRLPWSFPDPSRASGSEAEQLAFYRQVRDAIRERIERELIPHGARQPSGPLAPSPREGPGPPQHNPNRALLLH